MIVIAYLLVLGAVAVLAARDIVKEHPTEWEAWKAWWLD